MRETQRERAAEGTVIVWRFLEIWATSFRLAAPLARARQTNWPECGR